MTNQELVKHYEREIAFCRIGVTTGDIDDNIADLTAKIQRLSHVRYQDG